MSKITQDIIIGCSVFAGLVLLSVGSTQQILGSLTDQGAVVTNPPVETSMLKPAAWQLEPIQRLDPQLALGMMLVLFGLGLHVFFVLRRQNNKKGPLTVKRAFFFVMRGN